MHLQPPEFLEVLVSLEHLLDLNYLEHLLRLEHLAHLEHQLDLPHLELQYYLEHLENLGLPEDQWYLVFLGLLLLLGPLLLLEHPCVPENLGFLVDQWLLAPLEHLKFLL